LALYLEIVNKEIKMTQPTGKKTGYIELENGGTIKIEFYPDSAPNTVANFEKLANSGFYNGLTFHRVVDGFVAQGGDPAGNGTGGPGYKIKAEFNNRKHLTGTLAMARSQHPDSAGSQFYICLAPQPFLDGQYTVFGQVTEGMDLVQKIRIGDKMKTVKVVNE
jgi:peptidylprolyl isomerase/peptidyl-prolyl cis-trans isomerase B (cyclophilin B)